MAKTIIYDFANIHLNTYRIDEAKADIYISHYHGLVSLLCQIKSSNLN